MLLKRPEQLLLRRRLGESLARLLKEHEPPTIPEDTAVVFMTEVEAPAHELVDDDLMATETSGDGANVICGGQESDASLKAITAQPPLA